MNVSKLQALSVGWLLLLGCSSTGSPTDISTGGSGNIAGSAGDTGTGGTTGGTGGDITGGTGGTTGGTGATAGSGGSGGVGASGGSITGGTGAVPAGGSGGVTGGTGGGVTGGTGGSNGGTGGTGGSTGGTGGGVTGGTGGGAASGPLAMGYILQMHVGGVSDLDKLDYTAVDYVVHAFVDTNASTAALSGVGDFDAYRQAGLADKVHAAGSKIVMSIGGANHSWGMKEVAKSASLTSTFANNVVARINEWGYDGVDIDLEFPWGGNEPQEHLDLVTAVYAAVKANNPEHLVMFGVSPGWLIDQYVWSQLPAVSDYAFYFCYDWANPANGPMTNPGVNFTSFGGAQFEASCRGALDYMIGQGYPADRIIVGLPFYANGGAPWYTAPAGLDSIAPHPDYMEVSSNGYWTTPTAMRMKVNAVLNPAQSVLTASAVVAGVGWWEWGYEDPDDPVLSQAIKQELGK